MALPLLIDTNLRLTDATFYGQVPVAAVPTSRNINTTLPLTGGGTLATDLTLAIQVSPGAATTVVGTTRTISTTAPVTGGGDLSADRTIAVNTFGTSNSGVVPASGGGTTNFLRADGTWAAVASGGVPLGRLITTTAPLRIDGGASADLSADRTLSVNQFSAGASGIVPASGGGTVNFLRADGTWVAAGAGLFVRLQNSWAVASADAGNTLISGISGAEEGAVLGFPVQITPLGVLNVTHRQIGAGNPIDSLFTANLQRFVGSSTVSPSTLAFTHAFTAFGGGPSTPTSGTKQAQLMGNFYTVNNGYALAPILTVYQDGSNTNTAGYATQLQAADESSNFYSEWITSTGHYFKNATQVTKPTAYGTVHVDGSFATAVTVQTATYTATANDHTIFVDCTGGSRQVILPTPSTCPGREYHIRRIDINQYNYCQINGATGSIEAQTLYKFWSPLDGGVFKSDGTQWRLIAQRRDSPLHHSILTTGTTPVANTTAETYMGIFPSMLDPYPYTGSSVIRVRISGRYSTTGTPTIRVKIKNGSLATTWLDTGAFTAPSGVTDSEWMLEFQILSGATGTAGYLRGSRFQLADNNKLITTYSMSISGTTTAGNMPLGFKPTWQWGAADPANSAYADFACCEVLDSGLVTAV